MLTRGYSGSRAYAQSKLAQIMFTFDLARELDPEIVTANCLHPATYRRRPWCSPWLNRNLRTLQFIGL
jgi:NAD(P)-dependent dehydrogenase (short-subunit alcohol dehydrogenase family)